MRQTDRWISAFFSASLHASTCWYTLSMSVPSRSNTNEASCFGMVECWTEYMRTPAVRGSCGRQGVAALRQEASSAEGRRYLDRRIMIHKASSTTAMVVLGIALTALSACSGQQSKPPEASALSNG